MTSHEDDEEPTNPNMDVAQVTDQSLTIPAPPPDAALHPSIAGSFADDFAFTPEGERAIVVQKHIQADRAHVRDAFLDAEKLCQWMTTERYPIQECVVDPVPGGLFRYVWKSPETGDEVTIHGLFVELNEDRIVHQENLDTETGDEPHQETHGRLAVSTTFAADPRGGTDIRMHLEYPTPESRDAVLESPMERGMRETFTNLAELLAPRV